MPNKPIMNPFMSKAQAGFAGREEKYAKNNRGTFQNLPGKEPQWLQQSK
jgi:hypothetical protein